MTKLNFYVPEGNIKFQKQSKNKELDCAVPVRLLN